MKNKNFFLLNKDYALKIKNKSEKELKKLNTELNDQKQQLLILVNQARYVKA